MTDPGLFDVDVVRASDALARDISWAHQRDIRVLGIPVVCQSNSRYVCDRFADAFAVCQHEEGDAPGAPALVVRIAIVDWPEEGARSPDVRTFALDGHRLLLHSSGGVAWIDPERREAVAFVGAAIAADRRRFTRHVLDAMTLALLTHYDRHPVHGSAVVHGANAVLLVGPSGSGKSTLAHAAHEAGLMVLSEDTVWIQQQPQFRVWGLPRAVHLLDGSSPEKRVVALTRTEAATPCSASAATVCLLERGHRSAQLERLGGDAIAETLSRDVASGFDRYPDRHRAVVRRLAAPGGWRLKLTDDASAALPLLTRMLNAGTS